MRMKQRLRKRKSYTQWFLDIFYILSFLNQLQKVGAEVAPVSMKVTFPSYSSKMVFVFYIMLTMLMAQK